MSGFRHIATVPSHTELVDIILNKTQRKTPTQLHAGEHISKARNFYTKKVRFISSQLSTRLSAILSQFPSIDSLHPFFTDLFNVLYDKSAYKQSLGHISVSKSIAVKICSEHIKLIKYAETHYRAKQLKRACFGRLASLCLKLKDTLSYLEEVRQSLGRMPSIDPVQKTLLLAGHPNVGKSSFVNCISRASVDVQPYAFTTKNLFVGHFDFEYMKWQVIDTPGILDSTIEGRNLIEMQAVTALAHVKACVLFLIDLSTSCGFSVADQISLCEGVEPLLGNVLVVLSKVDAYNLENMSPADNTSAAYQNDSPTDEDINSHKYPQYELNSQTTKNNATHHGSSPTDGDLNCHAYPQCDSNSQVTKNDESVLKIQSPGGISNDIIYNNELGGSEISQKGRSIDSFIEKIDFLDSPTLEDKITQLRNTLSKVETLSNDPETLNKLVAFLSTRRFTAMSAQNKVNVEKVKTKGCKILLEDILKNKKVEIIEKNLVKIIPVQPKKSHPQEKGSFKITEEEAKYFNTSRFAKHGKTGREWKFQTDAEKGLKKDGLLERHKYEMNPQEYVFDIAQNYVCENGHDIVPEFFYGKNISDFIDPHVVENLNIIENEELNKPEMRKYDILTQEERLYVETIRCRQRAKEIEHSLKQRSTLPQQWIENRDKKAPCEDLTIHSNVVQRAPEKIKRNTFMKTEYRRYYDKRPQHLNISSRGKKGALYR